MLRRILVVVLMAFGLATGEAALEAQAARGVAAQNLSVNEQGFIQFALRGSPARRGVQLRLTAQQKSSVVIILRDARRAAALSTKLARRVAVVSRQTGRAVSIQRAAGAVESAAVRQDFAALNGSMLALRDVLVVDRESVQQYKEEANAMSRIFEVLQATLNKLKETQASVASNLR